MLLRIQIAAIVLASATDLARAQGIDEVRVSSSGSGVETAYEIRPSGACRIRWVVSRSGVNVGIAQYRAQCNLSLKEQMPAQAKILARVLAGEPQFQTLFLGRLAAWPELSQRLAAAAQRSAGWDAKAGRPKTGALNPFLLELASAPDSDLFGEWKRIFEDHRLTLQVAGVEKASIGADKLPYDCLIWFSVRKTDRSK